MSSLITVSICLDDIPEIAKKKSDKNQKQYVEFVVNKRKSVDNFGNTHTVYLSQSKEERTNGAEKKYVGNAKEIIFKDSN